MFETASVVTDQELHHSVLLHELDLYLLRLGMFADIAERLLTNAVERLMHLGGEDDIGRQVEGDRNGAPAGQAIGQQTNEGAEIVVEQG